MQIIKPDTHIDFVGKQFFALLFSGSLILMTIISLIAHKGPKYGIDFAGGSIIQIKFSSSVNIGDIRSAFETIHIDVTTVQQFGEHSTGDYEYLVNTGVKGISEKGFADRVKEALKKSTGLDSEILRVEMVGPKVGHDLRGKALMAIFFALLFINIYISGRFELKWLESAIVAGCLIGAIKLFSVFGVSLPILIFIALGVSLLLFWILNLKYAMGAIVALIHDVSITVGIFSITNKEFSLPIIAALLTIIGYSLNDTIIVFDRIRENLKKYAKKPLAENINGSINETLSRTLLTSGTTMIVILALFLFGGSIIHDFAFAMIVGVGVGTYSSIFVASPILLWWQNKK